MIKQAIISFGLGSIFYFASCKEKLTPVEYNDKIVNEQVKIAKLMFDIPATINDPETTEITINKAIAQADSSIENLEKLGGYKGDNTFQQAAINLFKFYKEICQKDFREMFSLINQMKTQTEPDSQAVVNRIQEISQNIAEKEKSFDESFANAQKSFAEKYQLKLDEQSFQKKLEELTHKNSE